jgi:hypothetical protein
MSRERNETIDSLDRMKKLGQSEPSKTPCASNTVFFLTWPEP